MKKLTLMFMAILVLLSTLNGTAALAAPEKVKVLIGFDRAPGRAEEALVRGLGGDIGFTYSIVPAIAASVPAVAIPGLLKNQHVTMIEPDIEIQLEADGYPWGVIQIGADQVHQSDITGQGVKVAILDTGIDYTHPELSSVYKGGYDFVNGDRRPMDDNGHGTHVAGTIAAAINGSGIVGVAPGVEIYALKVLNSYGYGSFSNVIAALEWATGGSSLPGSVKVDITNNSYGSSSDPGSLVEIAFWLAYYSDGVLSVAAAGNGGNSAGNGNNIGYPAAYDSVIAVAATDQANDRAYFSSTGPEVELAAPGAGIYSTVLNGGYETWSGTSMASPHAVGVAALVMSSPEIARDADSDGLNETNGDGVWTNEEVRYLLRATADDLGVSGKDNLYGYGLVNAAGAALVPGNPDNTPPVADAGPDRSVKVNETVTLDGQGSIDTDGYITDYDWDFGDGSSGTGAVTAHAYGEPGTYSVVLTVTDNDGATATDMALVTVADATSGTIQLAGIDMGLGTHGINTVALATVTVVDATANPVAGATVYGQWSGATTGAASGVTDYYGRVTFQSKNVKRAASGTTFTFTVERIELGGSSIFPGVSKSIIVP